MNLPDAVLGFVAAAVPGAGVWWQTRTGFTQRVMEMVETRCVGLEKEVAECRQRDALAGARIMLLEGVVKMAVPELARLDRGNVVLAQAVHALNALPETTHDWKELLGRIDEAEKKREGTDEAEA